MYETVDQASGCTVVRGNVADDRLPFRAGAAGEASNPMSWAGGASGTVSGQSGSVPDAGQFFSLFGGRRELLGGGFGRRPSPDRENPGKRNDHHQQNGRNFIYERTGND